ncbi:MAG: hypothetical protein ABI725_00320 [Chloroflexota bacterium]
MLKSEAAWLGAQLSALPVEALSPLLNIGSGPRRLREEVQPYIEELVFQPQLRRGVTVVHSDINAGPGIDVAGDIFDDKHLTRLAAVSARALICSNMHEHVRDPAALTRRYMSLLPAGGYAAVTVPYSFPYHRDPIDSLFRPDLASLRALHEGTEVVAQECVVDKTYADEVHERPLRLLADLVRLPRVIRDTGGLAYWRPFWLRRHYLVSCLMVRKEGPPG